MKPELHSKNNRMLNNQEHLIYGLFLDVFADVEVILRGTWNSVKTALCLFFFLFCFFTSYKQGWALLMIC